jgi:hypothetical protein
MTKGDAMSAEDLEVLEDMGPVDWIVLGWRGTSPVGSGVAPMIIDLVDRGIIRVLDIAFVSKDDAGNVIALDLDNLGDDNPFTEFEGASTGLISQTDLDDAAEALDPGDSAAVLIWENRWAAPIAVALRRSGGQLLASGRVEIQALLASLDALEASAS